MTIKNTFPSDKRRPGISHEFDKTSGSRSLVTVQRRIALVGIKDTSGLATVAIPIQIFNEADADTQFGIGSELALMCRAAFTTFVDMGTAAEVWAVPVAAPAGAAATGTFVITGPSTESGDIVFSIAGRVFRAPIASGATATQAGDAMVAAVNAALFDVPGTVVNVTGTVTYTHKHLGVNGNAVKIRVRSKPAGISIALTQPASGTGAIDITAQLDTLQTQDYQDIAIANHAAADVTDLAADAAISWGATRKRWRHYYLGENGSLATATGLNPNDERIIVISFELSEAMPSVMAAAIAAMVASREAPNYNFDGTELTAIPPIENPADIFIDSEIETALAAGVTPITVGENSGRAKVERLVTSKKALGSNPFFDLLDIGPSKTMAYTARQVDAAAARIMKNRNIDEDLVRDVKTSVFNVLKREEELGYLQNVDAHAAELKVEKDPNVIGRLLVEIPESVVPNCHQIHGVHRLFVGE